MPLPDDKMNDFMRAIAPYRRVVAAFSGGVDSTLLLRLCRDALGPEAVIAVTGVSSTYTDEEKAEACRFAAGLGLEHILIETDELACAAFAENTPQRCYHCKKELYGKLSELAAARGAEAVFDATNADDLADYRPGRKAAAEYGVISPFVKAGFNKEDIRSLSRELGLASWDKPANPCLASRVPYGTAITAGILERIRSGEKFVRGLGFPVVRLRHHGDLARIEVPQADFKRILDPGTAFLIADHMRSLGYLWTSLDMEGYRTGSLNRALAAGPSNGGGRDTQ